MLPPNSLPAITGFLLTHQLGSLFPFTGPEDRFDIRNAEAEVRFRFEGYGTEDLDGLSAKVKKASSDAIALGVALLKRDGARNEVAQTMRNFLKSVLGDFPRLETLTCEHYTIAERTYVVQEGIADGFF